MTPERRRLLMMSTLATLAALVAWDRLGAKPDELVEATRAPGPAPAPASTSAAVHGQPVRIARVAPRTDYVDALEADAMAAAAAAPPPPAASAPEPPPPPAPPPFRVIGKGRVDGRWEVYLAQANRVVVARAGDKLDGQYEVVSIVPPTLQLTFLPTHEPRTLAIGAAFED